MCTCTLNTLWLTLWTLCSVQVFQLIKMILNELLFRHHAIHTIFYFRWFDFTLFVESHLKSSQRSSSLKTTYAQWIADVLNKIIFEWLYYWSMNAVEINQVKQIINHLRMYFNLKRVDGFSLAFVRQVSEMDCDEMRWKAVERCSIHSLSGTFNALTVNECEKGCFILMIHWLSAFFYSPFYHIDSPELFLLRLNESTIFHWILISLMMRTWMSPFKLIWVFEW